MKVDLHVHSKYSKKPAEWFLKRIGAAESYTEIDKLYNTLKKRGMDFVTITDHNTIKGCLKLKEYSTEDTFISVESTAHFPEDDCKIHLLIFDIDENIFGDIQRLRYNIYELRDFLIKNNIAHSVAHPLYSNNGKLTISHFEKLIILFNTFEVVNGCRGEIYNKSIFEILSNLTESDIQRLAEKHNIEPVGTKPWIKGFTGGSDDHSGFFLGTSFTIAEGTKDIKTFISRIKSAESIASGISASFYNLAFNIYKIAYDFSLKNKTLKFTGGILDTLNKYIIENNKLTLWDKIKLKRLKKRSSIHSSICDLIYSINDMPDDNVEEKFESLFDKIADFSDEIVKKTFKKIKKKNNISLDFIYNRFMSILPAIFISVPFYSSFSHMFKDKSLIMEIKKSFSKNSSDYVKKIAWFTDTINDLNGVSVVLKTIGRLSAEKGYPLKIFCSINKADETLPLNYVNIEPLLEFPLPYYNKLSIRIPSFMRVLRYIYEYAPDEIYISTPGPVGILGLIIGKLMNIKIVGIYHTDFTREIYDISKDENLTNLVERYVNFFYNNTDLVKATSDSYVEILRDRGIESDIDIFRRGIDTTIFKPIYTITDTNTINLLYVGRVSKDKNLDLLFEIFEKVTKKYPDLNIRLYIIGDGPYKVKLEKKYRSKNIIFTGKLDYRDLVKYYNIGDMLIFPSNTDTFGMVVLEAQACGLPAIVSSEGGPKDIVQDGITGSVANKNDIDDWVDKVSTIIEWKTNFDPKLYTMKNNAVSMVKEKFNWDKLLKSIFTENYSDKGYPVEVSYVKVT